MDFEAAGSRDFLEQPGESRRQSQVVQHRRSQQHRNIPNDSQRLLHRALRAGDSRRDFALRVAVDSGDAGQFHAQPGQHLANLIVQFPRKILSLLLLRRANLARQQPQFRFRQSAIGAPAPACAPASRRRWRSRAAARSPVVQPSEIRNSRSAVVMRCRSLAKFAVTSRSTCSASAKISCRRRTRWRSISARCARFSSGLQSRTTSVGSQ